MHLLGTYLNHIRGPGLPNCIVHGMLGDLFAYYEHVMLKHEGGRGPCTLPNKASIFSPAVEAAWSSANETRSFLAIFHAEGLG